MPSSAMPTPMALPVSALLAPSSESPPPSREKKVTLDSAGGQLDPIVEAPIPANNIAMCLVVERGSG